MLGWTIMFALLSLSGAIPLALGQTGVEVSMKTTGILFALLFLASIFTRLVRGRT